MSQHVILISTKSTFYGQLKIIVAYCPLFRRNNFAAPEIQRVIFNISMVNESDPRYTQYVTTSNTYLNCIHILRPIEKRHIHLWPLWLAVVQGSLERFTDSDIEVDHVPCRSNSAVESYFKSVKHSRVGHSSCLKASDFVLRQLEYVQGKANELSLPPQVVDKLKAQKSTSHALDLSSVSWRKHKRSKLCHSKPTRTEAVGSLFSEDTPVQKGKRTTTATAKPTKRGDDKR